MILQLIRKLLILLLIITAILMPGCSVSAVYGETQVGGINPQPMLTTLEPQEMSYFAKFNSLVTLMGSYGANNFYFNIDRNWSLKNITLFLNISQSQVISDNFMSTLTVFLNNEPIQAYNLKDYMKDSSVITVPFSVGKIKQGVNAVRIQVYRRLSDKPCVDDVSQSNWVNISENSGVQILYMDKITSHKISEFPYPFLKAQQETTLPTAITVADHAGEGEIAGALEMGAIFGRLMGNSDVLFDTGFLDRVTDKDKKNVIFIARKENTPQELLGYFPQDTDFKNGAAIKFISSPYGEGRSMLLIIAENDADLIRAVKFLGNTTLTVQAASDYFYVDRNMNIFTNDEPQSPSFSFSELGYPGIYVYGLFRKNADLALKLPQNRAIDDSSSIALNFRYSENLDFNRSLATVFINDVPIGSKKLTKEKANGDTLTLNIPKEARKGNYFNLRIAFDLELQDVWCLLREEEMPWAYVEENSRVYLPTTQVLTNLFENFPSPFILDHQWNNTMFVLPEQVESADLDEAGKVAAMMGHEIKSNRGVLKVSTGFKNDNDLAVCHLVVIGAPDRQEMIKANNNLLYYKYEPGMKYFLSNEKIELLPEYSKDLVSFQLLSSPYNKNTAMLVLTAPDGEKLAAKIKDIFQPSAFSKLIGDGGLVNNNNDITNYRFKKEVIEKPGFWSGDVDGNTRIFLIVLLFALLLIIITLVLFLRKNKKMSLDRNPINTAHYDSYRKM